MSGLRHGRRCRAVLGMSSTWALALLIGLPGLTASQPRAQTSASSPLELAHSAPSLLEAEFVNLSRRTRCAEEDNVDVRVRASGVTRFTVTAEHPPYISLIRTDSTAPDFTDCDMSGDPVFRFKPRTVILYEDETTRLVGHSFETFWRPEVVDFRVGERREAGLHLVQLLRKNIASPGTPAARDVEILVVYPSDGYWRAKPLPPAQLPDSAYGSSFLVGPVEDDGRPIVRFRSIRFEPADLAFHLEFASGGQGVLKVIEDNRRRTRLEVTLDRPVAAGQSFAALRSMYVTADNADTAIAIGPLPGAQIKDQMPDAGSERHLPVMGFERFTGAWGRFGRTLPSRHNLSAPDTVFGDFAAPAAHRQAR
jgi:hypothetical protein